MCNHNHTIPSLWNNLKLKRNIKNNNNNKKQNKTKTQKQKNKNKTKKTEGELFFDFLKVSVTSFIKVSVDLG